MTVADDRALATAAARGDAAAFDALMRRHKEPLFRLLRALTGDADAALDLTQDTLVALWRARGRYDARWPYAAWARRIAINKARDWARRRAVRRWIGLGGAEPPDMPEDAPGAEQRVDSAHALRRLERAIAALPATLREALVLTAIDGRSQAEAAALLGVSVKAVETRIRRARQHLTETMGPR